MNAQDLLDESFGQLDPTRLAALDRACDADPKLSRQREAVRRAVAAMVDDGDDLEPPPGLASRTLALVAKHAEGDRARILEFPPPSSRVRWTDVAVAAVVLVASLLSIVPPIRVSQLKTAQLGCIDNLRQIGLALSQYATAHNVYPFVSPESPGSYVGSMQVLLHDSGFLPKTDPLDCPSGGCPTPPSHLPPFATLCAREYRQPGALKEAVHGDYAFNQGYRDGQGHLTAIPATVPDGYPLVADQPSYVDGPTETILEGNSPNHGGRGQNVAFASGHVQFRRNRWLSRQDTDLYLNQDDRLAPGLHEADAVVTPAVYRFKN